MSTPRLFSASRSLGRDPSAGIPGTSAWVEARAERLPGVARAEVLPSGRAVVHLLLVPSRWLPGILARLVLPPLVLPPLVCRALRGRLPAGRALAVEVCR
jgi:hypothetical protein